MRNVFLGPRIASAIVLFFTLTVSAGCETKGPVAQAGASIDKGIENVKDAIVPPGPTEKAGRAIDKALKN